MIVYSIGFLVTFRRVAASLNAAGAPGKIDLFAYEGGGGVALVKDKNSGEWGPVAFFSANEGSIGFQIGGQQSFVAILLMNTNAVRNVIDSNFNFGGEASGTAGNSTGKAEGTVSDDNQQLTLVYSDTTGLYGGAAVKGGDLSPDAEANVAYYGESLTPKEILFDNKGKVSESATALAQKITQFAK